MNLMQDYFVSLEEQNQIDLASQAKQAGLDAVVHFPTAVYIDDKHALEELHSLVLGLEQQIEVIRSAASDADVMSDMAVTLESFKVSGVDRVASEIIAVRTKSIYNRLGVTDKKNVSLESYGQTSKRIEATSIAVEDFFDKAREIWKAIIAAIVSMSKAIFEFLKKLFDANRRTSDRAKDLAKKLKNISFRPNSATIMATATISKLMVNKVIPENISSSLSTGLTISNGTISFLKSFDEVLRDSENLSLLAKDQGRFDKISGLRLTPTGFNTGDIAYNNDPEYLILKSPELPGNMCIVIKQCKTQSLSGSAAIDALSDISFTSSKFNDSENNTDVDIAKPIPTLSKTDMEEIVSTVIKVTESLSELHSTSVETEKKRKEWIRELEKVSALNVTDVEMAKRIKQLQKFAVNLNRISNELITTSSSLILKVCSASLDYVDKSILEYPQSDN